MRPTGQRCSGGSLSWPACYWQRASETSLGLWRSCKGSLPHRCVCGVLCVCIICVRVCAHVHVCVHVFVCHTHSLTHSLTHTHTHNTLTHSHTLTHSLTHTHTLTHIRSLTHTLTHSLTHSINHSHSYSLTHPGARDDGDMGPTPQALPRGRSGLRGRAQEDRGRHSRRDLLPEPHEGHRATHTVPTALVSLRRACACTRALKRCSCNSIGIELERRQSRSPPP